jgi:hypothetical protein
MSPAQFARAAALVAACAVPVAARAQFARTFALCNVPAQFCAGVGLSLTGSTLTVGLRNNGAAPHAGDSFLSAFGVYGGGITGGTLATRGFVGAPGLPAGFAADGAPNDLNLGQFRPLVGADFGNGGFRPCGYGDTMGGNRRLETCDGEYGLFTFQLVGANLDLSAFQFAVRAQGLQLVNGGTATSDKCFSTMDANCAAVATARIEGTPVAVVPEATTGALVATGLAGVFGAARRRRRG